jgi:PAS domain S-box-containing protein
VTLFAGQAGNLNTQRASQIFGFAGMAIAVVALVGWRASLPLLSSWGSAAMTPMSAMNHAALGVALMHPGKDSRFSFVVSLVVIATAALDFAINRGLVSQAIVPGFEEAWFRSQSGMPSATALAAAALALSRFERHYFVAIMLSGVAALLAVFAVLGYLTGFDMLRGTVRSPGLPTAVSLLCIVIGIVLRIGTIPAPHRSRPLWRLLVLLACAVIAPLLLLAVYTGFRITDAQLDQANKDLMNDARTLSGEVDREIVSEIEKLQALAVSPSLRQGDFAAFQRQAEASLAFRRGGNIMLVDRNMQQLVNTWVPFGTPLEKAAIPEPVERALATGEPQIAGLFSGSETQQLVLGIFVPVQIDGENRYALVRPVDQSALASLVAARRQRPDLHVAISDAAGRIIVRSEQEDTFVGKPLLAPPGHCPGAGVAFEFTDSAGRPSLGAYACSDLTRWQTAVWEPKELLDASVRALWWTVLWTAVLAFTLVVALALWLSRIVAHSVDHAARAAIALGKGGPLVLDGTPVAEVNILMAELQRTAAKRQTAEQQLQASKDRLQLAFDATQLGWWQYDPRRATALMDARCRDIFGVTAAEIPIEDIIERVHPDDREIFRANREAALDPTNPKPYLRHEYRVRRPDGTVCWVETNALANFEGSGRERRVVNVGGTVQDITERKEREEKEHLLMREINHRAKNMLSVVDSIAHQTAARSPEDFVERFSERIQALSANQDLLVRNEWQGVDVGDLVRAQLAHFADLVSSRIAVRGPKLRLNPASAQAIGLALHELATNAGKYGSLSTDKGRVDIGWDTSDDTFTMTWTEREGPPVSSPTRRGFGTVVIKSMTERGVRGTVDFDYAPSGVTWHLTCPAANALEPGWGPGGVTH